MQYESQDQAFSFQKQVRFKDDTSSPELRPVTNSGEGRPTPTLLVIPPRLSDISGILHQPHPPHHSSTPYRVLIRDRTFDVEPSTPLMNESRQVANKRLRFQLLRLLKHPKNFGGCGSQRLLNLEAGIRPTPS